MDRSGISITEILDRKRMDPEKFLHNLGFSGPDHSLMTRLPTRFLQQQTIPQQHNALHGHMLDSFLISHPEFKNMEQTEAWAAALEIYSKLPLYFHHLDSVDECTSLHNVVASNSPVVQQRLRRGATSVSENKVRPHKPPVERAKSLASRRKSKPLQTIGERIPLSAQISRASTAQSLSSCDVTDESDDDLSPIQLNSRIPAFSYPLPAVLSQDSISYPGLPARVLSQDSIIDQLAANSMSKPLTVDGQKASTPSSEVFTAADPEGSGDKPHSSSEIKLKQKQFYKTNSAHKLGSLGESKFYSIDDCDEEDGICLVSPAKRHSQLRKTLSIDSGSFEDDYIADKPNAHWENEVTVPPDHWSRQLVTPEHVVKQNPKLQRSGNNSSRTTDNGIDLPQSKDILSDTDDPNIDLNDSKSLQNDLLPSYLAPAVTEEVLSYHTVSDLSQSVPNGVPCLTKRLSNHSLRRLVKQPDNVSIVDTEEALQIFSTQSNGSGLGQEVFCEDHKCKYVCRGCGGIQPVLVNKTQSTQTEPEFSGKNKSSTFVLSSTSSDKSLEDMTNVYRGENERKSDLITSASTTNNQSHYSRSELPDLIQDECHQLQHEHTTI